MVERDLRLLCLDGGGVRGLSSLYILKQLMEVINPDNPPKPCNFFDMIGGTSTGGLIAVMLGRLRMDVDRCIDVYINMMDQVFKKKHSAIKINGQTQARFDTQELERAIKHVIVESGLPVDTTMRDRNADARDCKVFICASSAEHRLFGVQFSNYCRDLSGNSELLNNAKIWEACRATSAATSFFSPIKIGRNGQEFLDGATGANNPIRKLWNEAIGVWGSSFEKRIQCLVSIGTGKPAVTPFGQDPFAIAKTLVAIATETEKTADEFRKEHQELDYRDAYYRFNVSGGLEDVGLEEAKSKGRIQTMTYAYMDDAETMRLLRQFLKTTTQSGDILKLPEVLPTAPPRASAFLTLDHSPKYFQCNAESYWEHLTLDALQVYESIYQAAADQKTGLVEFGSLFHQLSNSYKPRPELISRVWQRIDERRTSRLPRNLVLAVLYMLHVEFVMPEHQPKPISPRRRKVLECFGNWVTCACGCGREWNFAGGFDGLRRDQLKRKKCLPSKWKDAGPFERRIMDLRQGTDRGPELYDQNRTNWLRGRQYAQSAEPAELW